MLIPSTAPLDSLFVQTSVQVERGSVVEAKLEAVSALDHQLPSKGCTIAV